jgi:DNA polymerase-3 subunit epsilon
MKKVYIDLKTSGDNPNYHGIIQIGGIIDIDNTKMDTFNIECRPCLSDQYDRKYMERYNLTWDQWTEDSERLYPKDVMTKLLPYLDKHVDKSNLKDKFLLVEHSSTKSSTMFLEAFFRRNKCSDFDLYFWFPPIDIQYVASFILEEIRCRFCNMSLETIAYYFGFDINEDEVFDSFYRVNLIRNVYCILEKFKIQKVPFKKAKLN